MRPIYNKVIGTCASVLLASCQQDIPMVSLGVDSQYRIERMRKLILRPEFTGEAYRWTMKDSGGADSTVSTEREFIFVAEKPGTYALRLDIIDAQNPVMQEVEINVDEESVAYSRYITEVYEYRPAPGQFVNIMPLYEEGDTEEDMCRKARESISGTNDIMISLGGYGGYVTFGFDHTVVNVPGQKDFKILGNAFYADANPNPSAPDSGGSCEPGIVMVSIDQNNNGLPDDEWYELAGSEYHKPETRHGFQITYTRPARIRCPRRRQQPHHGHDLHPLGNRRRRKGLYCEKRLPQPGLLSCVDCRRPVAVQRDASGRQRRGRKRWKRLLLCPLRLRMGLRGQPP